MKTARNVLILSGDADGNLGDRAILYATCRELHAIAPTLRIAAVSNQPLVVESRRIAESIPRGPAGFVRLLGAAARADLIICGGGGLFQDDDSLIKMPYWAARILLMRFFCRSIVGYSLGVGPLNAASSRWSARLAFACMRDITTRDAIAQSAARQCTGKRVSVLPDPAFLLPATSADVAGRWLSDRGVESDGRPIVGITVRRWYPARSRLVPNRIASFFRRGDAVVDEDSARLCALLAATLDRLTRDCDARVVFLPTYNVPHEGDDRLCLEIQKRMTTDPGHILRIDDPSLYQGVCRYVDVMLGGRMHPAILAFSVCTPAVGLAYNAKFRGLFALLGLDRYVMDVGEFVTQERSEALADLVRDALRNQPEFGEKLSDIKEAVRGFLHRIPGADT